MPGKDQSKMTPMGSFLIGPAGIRNPEGGLPFWNVRVDGQSVGIYEVVCNGYRVLGCRKRWPTGLDAARFLVCRAARESRLRTKALDIALAKIDKRKAIQ